MPYFLIELVALSMSTYSKLMDFIMFKSISPSINPSINPYM